MSWPFTAVLAGVISLNSPEATVGPNGRDAANRGVFNAYAPEVQLTALAPFAGMRNVTVRIGYSCTAVLLSRPSFTCVISENRTGITTHAETWEVSANFCRGNSSIGGSDAGVAGFETGSTVTGVETHTMIPPEVPTLWSTTSPFLYTLRCVLRTESIDVDIIDPQRSRDNVTTIAARFGFREFGQSASGQLTLNGRPIFLRGNSQNPPGRGVTTAVSSTHAFAMGYLGRLRDWAHVNAVRIGDGATSSNQGWYSAADELGMLIYAGPYSSPDCKGCKAKPATLPPPAGAEDEMVAAYEKVLMADAPHPSHVVMILANENDLNTDGHWGPSPYGGAYAALLKNVTRRLSVFDPTRVYIGDAGFGQGRGGDILDDHTYYGWYNGDVLSYYSDAVPISDQPYTFTECVGNYNNGFGDFDVGGKNLAWSLKWAGLRQGHREGAQHLMSITKASVEIVRRFRRVNPQLAGLMTFTTPFYLCGDDVTSFDDVTLGDMSPAMWQMTTSYAPVLTSIEIWAKHIEVGGTTAVFWTHIVNDDDSGGIVGAGWHLGVTVTAVADDLPKGAPLECGSVSWDGMGSPTAPIAHFATEVVEMRLNVSGCASGPHILSVALHAASGEMISTNNETIALFEPTLSARARKSSPRASIEGTPSRPTPSVGRNVILLDSGNGATGTALDKVGVHVAATITSVSELHSYQPTVTALIVGEDAWSIDLAANGPILTAWVETGGTVLVLQQSGASVGLNFSWAPGGEALSVTPPHELTCHSGATYGCLELEWGQPLHMVRPEHPIFSTPFAITPDQLAQWNDFSNWSESNRSSGPYPQLSPVAQTVLLDTASPDPDLWRRNSQFRRQTAVLGARAIGLQHKAVVEFRGGGEAGGVVLFAGLGLATRVGVDAVAERMLVNTVRYTQRGVASDVDLHPRFERGETIQWGNYSTERGVVSANLEGLIVNPCPVDPECKSSALASAPCGRTALGPFNWTYMGHNTDLNPSSPVGVGMLWVTVSVGVSKVNVTLAPALPDLPHADNVSIAISVLDQTWKPSGSAIPCPFDPATSSGVCTLNNIGPSGSAVELVMHVPKDRPILFTAFS